MKRYFLPFLLIGCIACNQQVPIDDIKDMPVASEADSAFNKVFSGLHGKWVGDIEVFRDDSGAARDEDILHDLTPSVFNRPKVNSVQMMRSYRRFESQTPYFQKADLQDVYLANNASVVSEGVNKVQDGKLWRVIHKPDETIIREGTMDGPETIIWQRNEQNPQKIEYFRETVSGDTYTVLGWGYYEGDDTSLMPRYWYYGFYKRDY